MHLTRCDYELPLKPNTVVAYNDKGQWLDLTSKLDATGKLDWTAPTGNWKLYALFIGWHGKMVERAAPGGEGDVIDHFNAPALQHYLASFDQAFKAKDLSASVLFLMIVMKWTMREGKVTGPPAILMNSA
jgi:hypothetical protein